jgi:hypothetical protein
MAPGGLEVELEYYAGLWKFLYKILVVVGRADRLSVFAD